MLLFVIGNNINFEGLPTGIGKLYNLVILVEGAFQKSGLMAPDFSQSRNE